MRIIRPVEVTNSVLTSSDIPENDYPEWDNVTTYNVDDQVIVTGTVHKIYKALQNNTNSYPPDNTGGTSPDWLDMGATNRWRMFDGATSTLTTSADSDIIVELTPNSIVTGVTLFNLSASTVNVVMTDPLEGEVYNRTINLVDNSSVFDWWGYFYEPIIQKKDVTLIDLPAYVSATITITISGTTPSVGLCVIGAWKILGQTDYGTGVGITDYSIKEADAFGNFFIQPRRFSKRADYTVTVDTPKVGYVQRLLADYRTTPLVWIGVPEKEETIIYGYYRDFSIILSNFSISDCSIEVEGL